MTEAAIDDCLIRLRKWRSLIAGIALGGAMLSIAVTPVVAQVVAPQSASSYNVSTRHTGKFGGKRISYTATLHETPLLDDKGAAAGRIVSISYVADRAAPDRPVVFVFNGGPGSASVWLHMGLVGPRRVNFGDDVHPETAAPFSIADNDDSILDVADVVLFDPPGTGFSRVYGDNQTRFFGLRQDAAVTVDFIEDWLRRHKRWNAPKFVMGESYGSIRAAAVAKSLAGTETGSLQAVTLNGVLLLGQALDFFNGGSGDDRGVASALSAMAATTAYHKRGAATPEQAYRDATHFVMNDYVPALFAGNRLSPVERERVAARIAALLGVGKQFVLDHDLRVTPHDFMSELLRDRGQQVGLYDGRYTLPIAGSDSDTVGDDPAMAQYVPGYVAVLNDYLVTELKAPMTDRYLPIDFSRINSQWDWGSGVGVSPSGNYGDALGTAMRRNPALKLFVAAGYFDLATPPGNAEYVLAHSNIPASATTVRYYESGHMPYIGATSRRLLASDLRTFIRAASTPAAH